MFCAHCGNAVAEGARFCAFCGAAVEAAGYDGPPPQPQAPQPPGNYIPQPTVVTASQVYPPGGQAPVAAEPPPAARQPRGTRTSLDPRQQQIRALKLELKRLRIEMQQVNAQLSQIRANYRQGRPFVPWGVGNRIYREVENVQMLGPQQRKQALQQQIIQIEQQILALESQIGT